MSNPRHALGHAAETAVATWLEAAGWTILARRIRAGSGGEIDLVALDPTMTLVALEVRARRSSRTGVAAASVDHRRVRRLEASLIAMARSAAPHRGLRVDLVTLDRDATGSGWRVQRIPGIGGR